jgi:hypothetical protein
VWSACRPDPSRPGETARPKSSRTALRSRAARACSRSERCGERAVGLIPLGPRVDRANRPSRLDRVQAGATRGIEGATASHCRRRRPTVVLPLHWAPNEPRRGLRGGGPSSVRLLQARYVSFRRQRTCASSSVGRQCARNGTCTAAKFHYSITSSATASSVGGTVSPSTLAVLRLITSSNFVGC